MKYYYSGFLILLVFVLNGTLSAQKFTISGTIRDAQTGEVLPGAAVIVGDKGASANSYGFYSLTLPAGNYDIRCRFVGYRDSVIQLNLQSDRIHDFKISTKSSELNQVIITATDKTDQVRNTQMGTIQLDMKEINKIPVIFGEKDILKSIQLLPGVLPAGDGNAGYYVRGGSADQNLILLDEAPVYNPSHFLGFFSTFNSDAILTATLYKGNMPSHYGGRIASVLDIRMKEGNNRNYAISGGIGLITSRLAIEGPIVKNKGSFIVTGRTTYADLFLRLSSNERLRKSRLNFYDINAKANYRIGKKDHLYISGYFGNDLFSNGGTFDINYGNKTVTTRWNHIFSPKLFSNTSFIYNDFNYRIGLNSIGLEVYSYLRNYHLKQDFDLFLSSKNKLKFGFQTTMHEIIPGDVRVADTSKIEPRSLTRNYGWENALYVQHDADLGKRVKLSYGLRFSTFSVTGPGKQYKFLSNGLTDTTKLAFGQFGNTYINPEPRISLSYNFSEGMSFKFAYARNTQNIHQLSNSTSASPVDRWILSSNNTRTQISDQGSVGYFANFLDGMLELNVEGYFKWMQNQIDYKNGATLIANDAVESQLIYGVGKALGGELMLKKSKGKFTGWISYTLSTSQRRFKEVNDNAWFNSRFDRRHALNIVLMYDITPRINISATFVYLTGNAVTFPGGKYELNGQIVPLYGLRNQDRMPAYHRLDIGATFILKKKKNWEHDLNISFYNIYARKNAFSINFNNVDAANNITVAEKTYLFRIVPSITYNFKFTFLKKHIK